MAAAFVAVATAASSLASPASAGVDENEPEPAPTETLSRIYVANNMGSEAGTYNFVLGTPDSIIEAGDWDGDGKTGFATRRANVFSLTDQKGYATGSAAYGRADDVLVIGDWDGNGSDTFGVRRRNEYYLRNTATTGVADVVFAYGRAPDEIFVGDWDGDGTDTFAVRRRNVLFVRNSTTTGVADVVFGFGRAGDEMYVGDWNGDGVDSFAVRRDNEFFINNTFQSGPAEFSFSFGKPTDQALVGDWDGNGTDTFALRRIVDDVPPIERSLEPQDHVPFAATGGITLVHPAREVELIGFHEAGHTGSQQMTVSGTAVNWTVLDTRYRGTGSRTAADIAIEPDADIYAPVTGTVKFAGTYTLYCQYRDDFVYISPDDQPGWEVRMFHIDGVLVSSGQRVVAGQTKLAPRVTRLPFESQIDELTGEPSWPHVHVEVVNPDIPDQRRGGGGC